MVLSPNTMERKERKDRKDMIVSATEIERA